MKFRRLSAITMAGIMAASTAIVCQVSASAEDYTLAGAVGNHPSAWTDIQVFENGDEFLSKLLDYDTFKIEFKLTDDGVAAATENLWLATQIFGIYFQDIATWNSGSDVAFGIENPYNGVNSTEAYTASISTEKLLEAAKKQTGMTTDEEAIKASKAIFRTAQMGGINITSAYLTDPKSTSAEVTDISLDQTTLSLKAGETATLKATTTPADAEVTWKSSNENIATVKDGVVTAVAAGEATITATAGEKTAECAVTVTAAAVDPGEAGATSDYALLYDGEFKVTDKYEGETIPVKAVAGDKITVTYKLNDAGAYHQLSFKHAGEGWPALTSPEYTNEWKCVDVSKDGTFTFTLNAEDAANITANKLVISGYSVTYTKVELNADKKPDDKPDASSSYDTLKEEKVSDFKTDGSKELYVMSITADDVKNNSAYEIKVTLSNGKSLTKTTSKCFKKFKYVNTSGDTVTESSSDNYFIVVKIINIPAGVTVDSVTITPVAN